ncbi:MAG: hypothetical protein ACOCWH_05695 [Spirochaetota bacterium]
MDIRAVQHGRKRLRKTSLARRLALRYGFEFVEADDFHSGDNRQRMASGMPLTDEMREPWMDSVCSFLESHGRRCKYRYGAFMSQAALP